MTWPNFKGLSDHVDGGTSDQVQKGADTGERGPHRRELHSKQSTTLPLLCWAQLTKQPSFLDLIIFFLVLFVHIMYKLKYIRKLPTQGCTITACSLEPENGIGLVFVASRATKSNPTHFELLSEALALAWASLPNYIKKLTGLLAS